MHLDYFGDYFNLCESPSNSSVKTTVKSPLTTLPVKTPPVTAAVHLAQSVAVQSGPAAVNQLIHLAELPILVFLSDG